MKKVGVVGAGVIADVVHIPGILRCPDLQLGALCDTNPARLEEVREKYNLLPEQCFTDPVAMMEQGGIDAVDICTPNDCHVEIALHAARRGLPFATEKPVGLHAASVQELLALVKQKELPNMVCFSYRFKAAARFARWLVQSGQLGEIYHVYMQYLQAWSLPVCEIPLVWRFQKERTGSGALGDLGSHALDLVRFVTGAEYEKVVSQNGTFIQQRKREGEEGMGAVDVDDFSNALAQMENGIPAAFQVTRYAYGRGNYQRLELYGSKGALVYQLDVDPNQDSLEGCFGEGMRQGNSFAPLKVPEQYRADQMQAFADILHGRGDGLPATLLDGLKNQQVLDAVLRSAASGGWENVVGCNR